MKDKLLRILSLVSGILMIIGGIYAVFHGRSVVGGISRFLGICAIIAGLILLCLRYLSKQSSARESRFMSADAVILTLIGFLLINTNILHKLGKILFIIVGAILIFHAVQSLLMAFTSKKLGDGWFIPRIAFCALLLLVGLWVFTRAGRVFDDVAGLVVGVYFIVHGASLVSDWIGREKYRRNFGFLDD